MATKGTRQVTGSFAQTSRFTLKNLIQDDVSRSSSTEVGNARRNQAYATGVKSAQANRAWELVNHQLTSGNDVEINLSTFDGWDVGGGAGNDALGLPMDVEEIALIGIYHESGAGELEVKPSPASGWTSLGEHLASDGAALTVGGQLVKQAPGESGFDVLPGTADRITLEAVGGDVTFSVLVIGRNDDDESSSSNSSSSSSGSSSSSSSLSSSSASSSSSST